MKKILFVGIGVLFLAPLALAGQVGEWHKVRESDGIISWSRDNAASRIVEVRTQGTIDAPVYVIEAILRDTPAMKKYLFMCSEAFNIEPAGLKSSNDCYYTYYRQSLPWPVWDRYGTGRIEFMLDTKPGGVVGKAYPMPLDYAPHLKSAIRMTVGNVTWLLVPLDQDSTKVTYQLLADPAGDLPSAVVNLLMKNMGITTLKNVRKLAKDEPYRSAKTIVTTTPYHD
jgi:hypothetical protein